MRPRRILGHQETAQILDQAVHENALVVLSVQEDDEWRTFKSHFLERDSGSKFFVLDYQETHGIEPAPLVPGQYVGISFRYKSRKIMFATVMEAKGSYAIDEQQNITAARYRWPESMTEMQRRAYHRTFVPDGTRLSASIWRGGLAARAKAQGSSLAVLSGEAVDLSCGGTLIRVRQTVPNEWREGQTFGLELDLGDNRPPIQLDAYYRGVRPDNHDTTCVAIQFVGLEISPDGREVLHRLSRAVQQFHRKALSANLRGARVRRRT